MVLNNVMHKMFQEINFKACFIRGSFLAAKEVSAPMMFARSYIMTKICFKVKQYINLVVFAFKLAKLSFY